MKKLVSMILGLLSIAVTVTAVGASEAEVNPDCDPRVAVVTSGYRAALGRDPEPAGLDFWLENLESFPEGLYASSEGATANVTIWYNRLFDRNPTDGDIMYWSVQPAPTALGHIIHSGEALDAHYERLGCERSENHLEVWDPSHTYTKDDYKAIIDAAAVEFNVSRFIMYDLIRCESTWGANLFNPERTRYGHARGPMQHLEDLFPPRAAAIGMPGASVDNPIANIRAAAWMISTDGVRPWLASAHCHGHY